MSNMLQLFAPGDMIYGYCQGAFGRDDYDDKVCVLVRPKYALFENEIGHATVLNYGKWLEDYDIASWKVKEDIE